MCEGVVRVEVAFGTYDVRLRTARSGRSGALSRSRHSLSDQFDHNSFASVMITRAFMEDERECRVYALGEGASVGQTVA
jgi:hypothetical protein